MRLGLGLSLTGTRGLLTPPPVAWSLNYSQADTAGGESITITGTLLTGATVTVGGTSATVTSNDATTIVFTMPAKAAGTYTVAVTTSGGTDSSLSIEAWSPAAMTLTGRWLASYSGSPWLGTVSSRNLTDATNPPATGSAYTGNNISVTPADFDGVNDKLGGAAESTFFAASAYTRIALIFIDTFTIADPGAAAPYSCPTILGDGASGGGGPCGGVAGTGASGVFRCGHNDGGWKSAAVAVGTGAWIMVMNRFTGTNIEVSKNGNAVVQTAAGNASTLANILQIGPNFGSAKFFDGKKLEGFTMNTSISDANVSKTLKYFNTRYLLSLA